MFMRPSPRVQTVLLWRFGGRLPRPTACGNGKETLEKTVCEKCSAIRLTARKPEGKTTPLTKAYAVPYRTTAAAIAGVKTVQRTVAAIFTRQPMENGDGTISPIPEHSATLKFGVCRFLAFHLNPHA